MRVMILDDEQLILNHLKEILSQFEDIDIVYESTSPREALKHFDEINPEVVFADIAMPEMNGVELAERIFEMQPATKLVFVTAYEQYAIEAFRVNAVDYVLKPITTSKISNTLNKLRKIGLGEKKELEKKESEKKESEKKEGIFRIIGTQNNRFYIIRPEEGTFIKTVAREQILVTAKGEYTLKNSLSYWEEKLKPYGWFRCHKGFLINLNEIEEVYPMFNYTYNIRMKGVDEEVLVSRTYVKEFKEILNM